MADGTVQTDLKIYHAQFSGGMYEKVAHNLDAFNGASAGTILMQSRGILPGQFNKEAFWAKIANLVTRRDMTSTSAATILKATQGELVGVKMNRKIGPLDRAVGALKALGLSNEELSFVVGQQFGEAKVEDMLDVALLALVAAIDNVAELKYDATGQSTTTLIPLHLVNGLKKMGDRAAQVKCWVMHSKPWFDLIGNGVSSTVTGIGDVIAYGGSPATLGRPVIVTDSDRLLNTNGSADDTYNVLGLVPGAAIIGDSSEDTMLSQMVDGLEQIMLRTQSEHDISLNLKGFAWDTGGGGANPNNTALGTGSNWDQAMTSHKDLAGILIEVK